MYKCNKCNKEFKYESKLNEHNNRKTICNKEDNYNCNICKSNFTYQSDYLRHEKTKKHIHMSSENVKTFNINYKEEYNKLLNQNKELNNKIKELISKNEDLTNKNIKFTNDINELNTKFKLLETSSNKELNNTEYIYIIHERTFVKTNANIYKIGKTKNIKNRLNGYSKGSKLLFTIPCNDCSIIETIILNYLKNNQDYYHAKEYGLEYFKCDLNNLINDIYKLVNA